MLATPYPLEGWIQAESQTNLLDAGFSTTPIRLFGESDLTPKLAAGVGCVGIEVRAKVDQVAGADPQVDTNLYISPAPDADAALQSSEIVKTYVLKSGTNDPLYWAILLNLWSAWATMDLCTSGVAFDWAKQTTPGDDMKVDFWYRRWAMRG